MKKLLRKSTVGAVAIVGLLGLGQTASAGQQAPVRITVAIYNYAQVPRGTVHQAQEVASRIYSEVGVTLEWVDPDTVLVHNPNPAARQSLLTSMLQVNLLSSSMEARRAAPMGVMGVAAPGTRVAQVLYSRVMRTSMKSRKDLGRILGHVIAHELGHLLLPPNSHSKAGLMSAVLDLQAAGRGLLQFTGEQADLIRVKATEPHAAAPAVTNVMAAALTANE